MELKGRIVAIDFGKKRTGIAVTDPSRIIASPLTTVESKHLVDFLKKYHASEGIEALVIGMPINLQGTDTDSTASVRRLIDLLRKTFPEIPVHTIDERFTSKIAREAMLAGGMKKKDRQNKATVDRLSAVIILQSFMEQKPTL
jgi:putative holliday junction resolvase